MLVALSAVPLERLVVFVAIVVSLFTLRVLDGTYPSWTAHLRRRYVLGIPWGTILTISLVLSVYLFVQDGLAHFRQPLVLPFRSWSYFYPIGIVFATFSHVGPGHLIGNVIGTIALLPVAEYLWGHYPTTRGQQPSPSLLTSPIARVFAVPAAVVAVGLVASVFGLGPVVGFSGVVFAIMGFTDSPSRK
jgi:membrane associated rhomboid family serine protease